MDDKTGVPNAPEKNIENPTNGGEGKKKSLIDLLNENPDLQSEFDKLNAKSIETAKSKWDEDAKVEKTEAEKLAKMDAESKHKYELEKEKERANSAESKLKAYELKETAIKIANKKGLNVGLLDVIDFTKETAESVISKIDEIEDVYKKAVESAVNEKLKEKSPKTVYGDDTTPKTNVSRASF